MVQVRARRRQAPQHCAAFSSSPLPQQLCLTVEFDLSALEDGQHNRHLERLYVQYKVRHMRRARRRSDFTGTSLLSIKALVLSTDGDLTPSPACSCSHLSNLKETERPFVCRQMSLANDFNPHLKRSTYFIFPLVVEYCWLVKYWTISTWGLAELLVFWHVD